MATDTPARAWFRAIWEGNIPFFDARRLDRDARVFFHSHSLLLLASGNTLRPGLPKATLGRYVIHCARLVHTLEDGNPWRLVNQWGAQTANRALLFAAASIQRTVKGPNPTPTNDIVRRLGEGINYLCGVDGEPLTELEVPLMAGLEHYGVRSVQIRR